MTTIGDNLRRARLAKGLTQNAVARALDTYEKTYRRWELGENSPSIATLRRLAEVLGVTVSTLIEESEL